MAVTSFILFDETESDTHRLSSDSHVEIDPMQTLTSQVNISLSQVDLNAIKSLPLLGNVGENTYLIIDSEGAVLDAYDQPIAEIDPENAVVTDSVIPDTTPPEFTRFYPRF